MAASERPAQILKPNKKAKLGSQCVLRCARGGGGRQNVNKLLRHRYYYRANIASLLLLFGPISAWGEEEARVLIGGGCGAAGLHYWESLLINKLLPRRDAWMLAWDAANTNRSTCIYLLFNISSIVSLISWIKNALIL